MNKTTVREFLQKPSFYLKKVPLMLTRFGEEAFIILDTLTYHFLADLDEKMSRIATKKDSMPENSFTSANVCGLCGTNQKVISQYDYETGPDRFVCAECIRKKRKK